MAIVTLTEIFTPLDGHHFDSRNEFEKAVVEVVNEHITELPIGFSYKDAIDGARRNRWLETNGKPGVIVRLAGVKTHA
jgi:hypothetical protein